MKVKSVQEIEEVLRPVAEAVGVEIYEIVFKQGKNPSIHAFNDCLTPDEMGHLSKILTLSEKLGNNQKECQDCVAAIQEAKKAVAPQAIGKLSDDDFLKLFTKK